MGKRCLFFRLPRSFDLAVFEVITFDHARGLILYNVGRILIRVDIVGLWRPVNLRSCVPEEGGKRVAVSVWCCKWEGRRGGARSVPVWSATVGICSGSGVAVACGSWDAHVLVTSKAFDRAVFLYPWVFFTKRS